MTFSIQTPTCTCGCTIYSDNKSSKTLPTYKWRFCSSSWLPSICSYSSCQAYCNSVVRLLLSPCMLSPHYITINTTTVVLYVSSLSLYSHIRFWLSIVLLRQGTGAHAAEGFRGKQPKCPRWIGVLAYLSPSESEELDYTSVQS